MGDAGVYEGELPTHFAPAARASEEGLKLALRILTRNAVIDNLMIVADGLLAILNEQRQILVVNTALLDALGIQDGAPLQGLRLGEAVNCIYAHEERAGCGTSKFCRSCNAVCAIMECLETHRPVETECAITARKDGKPTDFCFHVRCAPVVFDGQRFLLLFLHDITIDQQRAALERAFYHDISNVIESLLFNSRLLQTCDHLSRMKAVGCQVHELAARLASEIRVQRILSRGPDQEALTIHEVPVERVFLNLVNVFRNHPVATGKTLVTPQSPPDARLSTDASLLERVVMNMLTNAFEATEEGGDVRFWIEDDPQSVTFCVWNSLPIPDEASPRIFQRNFTTKPGSGRGLGTFGMRLLGETYLRGQVSFTTSSGDGTVFSFRLPKELSRDNSPTA